MFKFACCNADLSNVDVSGVTNFSSMFEMFGCVRDVTNGIANPVCTINLGSEDQPFAPAVNADFSHMFDMAQLTEIDLTHVDLNKGHKFSYMFNNLGQWFSPDIQEPNQIAATLTNVVSPFYSQINFPDET